MPKDKDSRQIFSVSKRYEEVFNILASTPNKSAFICEAIIAYSQSDKNLKQEDHSIRELVKKEIDEAIQLLIKDDMFIVKGNPSLVPVINDMVASKDIETLKTLETDVAEEAPQLIEPSPEDDEEYDLIMSISNQW